MWQPNVAIASAGNPLHRFIAEAGDGVGQSQAEQGMGVGGGGLEGDIRWCNFLQLQVGEFTALCGSEAGLACITCAHAAQAFGADIAADVFVRFFARGFGAGAQDVAACAVVFGVEFQHGLAGGAGACEEVENDVAGAGGLGEQTFDEGCRFGVIECPVTKNLRHLSRTLLICG